MISFWATLSLNIPDFSRYARTPARSGCRASLGLPATMAFYSFIGVAVTSATAIIYGKTLWDPVDVLTRFTNPVVLIVAMLALCVATLATNIAANVVGPANDFAQLAPRRISFRTGGLITGIIGILIMPWKLVADPPATFSPGWSVIRALLGPVAGILIADYFVLRHRRLDPVALYSPTGAYSTPAATRSRVSVRCLLAILPNLPGFLVTVHWLPKTSVPAFLVAAYDYAWFLGFAVAFIGLPDLQENAPNR